MSDNRADLTKVNARTLILQCSEDIIAGQQVGAYVQRNIPNSKMAVLKATGHCPNRTGEAGCLAGHGGFRDVLPGSVVRILSIEARDSSGPLLRAVLRFEIDLTLAR